MVRYDNPFARDAPPTVLHEAKDALSSAVVTDDGRVYAVSSKKIHSNESGKWKASAIKTTTRDGYFVSDVAFHCGHVWVADYYGFHRREDKAWRTVFASDSAMPCRMLGHRDLLYLGWRDGTAVWNEAEQVFSQIDPTAIGGATVDQPEFTSADGDEVNLVSGRNLYRGTAAGFRAIELEWPEHEKSIDRCVVALGATYIATYAALYRVDGKRLVQVMKATGWITRACAGNADVLWIANGTELLCTNGQDWKVVPRVFDAQTRA